METTVETIAARNVFCIYIGQALFKQLRKATIFCVGLENMFGFFFLFVIRLSSEESCKVYE